jgi:hypothetical protein
VSFPLRSQIDKDAGFEELFDERCSACRHHTARHAQDIDAKTIDEQRQYESDQSPREAQQHDPWPVRAVEVKPMDDIQER